MLENLARAGAFDGFGANRRQVFEATEMLLRYASAAASERDSPQTTLFDDGGLNAPRPELSRIEDWPALERLDQEFEAIGFYLSAHPLDAHGPKLERLGVVTYADLRDGAPGTRLAGIVKGRQERTSPRGNRFAFVQLSDTSGVYELTVFSELLAESRELLEPRAAVLAEVNVQRSEDGLRVNAVKFEPLEDAMNLLVPGLRIFVRDAGPFPALKALLAREAGGRGEVLLALDLADREVELKLAGGYALTAAARAAIKAVPGVVDVHDV